jgi:hypothetical protein
MAQPLSLTRLAWFDYQTPPWPPSPPTARQLAERRESDRRAKAFGAVAFRRMLRWRRLGFRD